MNSMDSIVLKYVRGEVGAKEYWNDVLSNRLISCEDFGDCEDKVLKILNKAFWELDALDRNDPFWNHTNKLATLYKLSDFAEYKLQNNIDIVGAAWLKIALQINFGGQHLNIETWKMLRDADSLDVDFLVKTAWIMSAYWSDENILIFSELVQTLSLQKQVVPILSQIAELGTEENEWVNSVIEHIVMS